MTIRPLVQCTTHWLFPLRHRGRCSHKEINTLQWLSLTWRIGCKGLAKFTKQAETMHDFCWASAAPGSGERGGADGCEAAEPKESIKHGVPAPTKGGFSPETELQHIWSQRCPNTSPPAPHTASLDSLLFLNKRIHPFSLLCGPTCTTATFNVTQSNFSGLRWQLKDFIHSSLAEQNVKWQAGSNCLKKSQLRFRNLLYVLSLTTLSSVTFIHLSTPLKKIKAREESQHDVEILRV